jgi:hypothetical protein
MHVIATVTIFLWQRHTFYACLSFCLGYQTNVCMWMNVELRTREEYGANRRHCVVAKSQVGNIQLHYKDGLWEVGQLGELGVQIELMA